MPVKRCHLTLAAQTSTTGRMANAAPATSANQEAARRGSPRLNQVASQKVTAANPSDRLPEYAANIQALVCVTATAAVASKAAAALALLANRQTGGSTQEYENITSQYVAAAQAAQDVEQLLQDCQAAMAHQAAMRQEYHNALRKQRAAMQDADALLQSEIKAAAEAPKQRKRLAATAPKPAPTTSSSRLSKYLRRMEQRQDTAVDRVALPAGTYYSIIESTIQHRQELHQFNLEKHRDQLKQQLQSNTTKYKSTSMTGGKQPRSYSTLGRLSTLCSMMCHHVAPFHLAMSRTELLLTALQGLPWLLRTRPQLQLAEQAELRAALHRWAQQKKTAQSLSGRARVAAAAAMSASARRQLLLFHSRYILAQEAGDTEVSTGAAQSRTWRGVSWALFPDGMQRELQSLTDRWRSCPDTSTMTKAQGTQQQHRTDSATARHLKEVRAYSTSPYSSFEEMLGEALNSSISAHNLQKIMANGRARSSPAAAAGYSTARKVNHSSRLG